MMVEACLLVVWGQQISEEEVLDEEEVWNQGLEAWLWEPLSIVGQALLGQV